MASNVSGSSQDNNRVIFTNVESLAETKKAKPGVFSQLKTWMKTRLYGAPWGGLLVRYGARKAMAAVKKHATAITLLREMKKEIGQMPRGWKYDKAWSVVFAQLEQAVTNLEKAKKALGSKEDDFNLLRRKDRETDKNMKAKEKLAISKNNLQVVKNAVTKQHPQNTGISRHQLKTVCKEMRATIKKEWDPGLFTRSAKQRKKMESVRNIILNSLYNNESKLKKLKQTKKENPVTLTSMQSLNTTDAEVIS